MWRIITELNGRSDAQMARDVELAQDVTPTLRLFTWNPPAMSYGWRQELPSWMNVAACRANGIELVERPTGGGIAFHGSDLSVSLVVPRALALPLESVMGAMCQASVRLCETYGVEATCALTSHEHARIMYCLTQPSPYAVFIDGRKVAGFALRRYPQTWLIQGSLLARPLPEALRRVLPDDVAAELDARAVSLEEAARSDVKEEHLAERWGHAWSAWWNEALCEPVEVST